MNNFTKRTVTEEDFIKYKDFFSRFKEFNYLNIKPISEPKGFISKVTSFDVEKIILKEDTPLIYIKYYKSSSVNRINILIINKEVLEEPFKEDLKKYILTEIFMSPGLFMPSEFLITIRSNEYNKEFLKELGFEEEKNHRIMSKNLDSKVDINDGTIEGIEFLSVKKVNTDKDIEDRVTVQNSVFQNKNRIPLEVFDVMNELSSHPYIKELSLICEYKHKPIGYGQIVISEEDHMLVNFGIVPEYRGKGYSIYFLKELLNKAYEYKVKKVFLEVLESNEKAIGLYSKFAFESLYNIVTMKWRP